MHHLIATRAAKPSSHKGGSPLQWWVWVIIGVLGLLLVVGVIVGTEPVIPPMQSQVAYRLCVLSAIVLVVKLRHKDSNTPLSTRYVQMDDTRAEEHLYSAHSPNPMYQT